MISFLVKAGARAVAAVCASNCIVSATVTINVTFAHQTADALASLSICIMCFHYMFARSHWRFAHLVIFYSGVRRRDVGLS